MQAGLDSNQMPILTFSESIKNSKLPFVVYTQILHELPSGSNQVVYRRIYTGMSTKNCHNTACRILYDSALNICLKVCHLSSE